MSREYIFSGTFSLLTRAQAISVGEERGGGGGLDCRRLHDSLPNTMIDIYDSCDPHVLTPVRRISNYKGYVNDFLSLT